MAQPHFDDITINTIIGAGSSIKGDLHIAGFIRIDGTLDGNLETQGRVIVGDNARIRANINASSVTVGGIVEGDIVAPEGVTVFSTGMIIGDVITKRLKIEDNVVIQGQCISIQDETKFNEAYDKWKNKKAISHTTFSIPRDTLV